MKIATQQMLFKRVTRVDISGDKWKTSFNADDLHMTFDVPFDSDTAPNEIIIKIYNLSNITIGRLGKGMSVTLQAGYQGDYGVLSRGALSSVWSPRDGSDRVTELRILDGQDMSGKKTTANITFKPNTKGETIIKKLVELLGVRLIELKIPDNKVFKKGYVVSGGIMSHLTKVAKDCGATVFWKRGNLAIHSLKAPVTEYCFLDENSGLIGQPEYFDEDGRKGYRAKCLLQHKICPGVMVEFKSRTANGKYRVSKGRHVNTGSEFLTEIEVF